MSKLVRHLADGAEEIDRVARHHEPAFTAKPEIFGQDAFGGVAQYGFFQALAHLEIDRDRFCRVVELMIEKRQSRLQRMSHFLAVPEEAQDIERHCRDSCLLV